MTEIYLSYRPSLSPTITPFPTTSIVPTVFPSLPPTDKPTPLPLPNKDTTIDIFDLSEDKYGAWRIPLIVIGMAIFHLVIYLLFKKIIRHNNTQYGTTTMLPPKTKPLSNKDKERHVIAKIILVICTCLALIFTLWYTISCKFASVGGTYQTRSTQRIPFGIWRFENENGVCESMDGHVDDPANALVASRVFSVLTCIILGIAFILICFLCLLNTPSVWTNQKIYDKFTKSKQYKMWIVAICLLYTSMWTTIYVFFIFGLNICHQPIDGYVGQYCKKGGSAKLALYNIFFLLFLTIVGIWYMWDALTPRPMTKDAAANNMRESKARQPIEVVDNPIIIEASERSTIDDPIIIDRSERSASRSNASNRSPRKSPKSPKKPPVKISQQDKSSPMRSPRPGSKKSVSVNDSRGGGAFDSSNRSPRPGTKRSQSANNVQQQRKSPPQPQQNNISPLSMRSAVSGGQRSKARTPRKSSRSPKKGTTTPNSSRSNRSSNKNVNNNTTTMPPVPDLLDDDDSSLEITKPRR